MKYIAHKRTETDGAEQRLIDHHLQVAKLCALFAAVFDGEAEGYNTGLLHDIGKYLADFQQRINGSNIKVEHSAYGAKEAMNRKWLNAMFCIAGHHSGLPDMGTKADGEDEGTLLAKLKRAKGDISAWKNEIGESDFKELQTKIFKDGFENSFYIRMLFSCLVDADFLDTEAFMQNGTVDRSGSVPVSAMLNRLENYTEQWKNPQGMLNVLREKILKECETMGKTSDKRETLFTLTVPTGGGKTVSSLAFALNYAQKHHKKRVIYVIPYTSIIEQNAEVFRKILGKETVVEHHSNSHYDSGNTNIKTDEPTSKAMLACENWDASLIVTTAVQFFESLYGNKSSKCRKLHNIADSVIIFDEAQMIPVEYLMPCIRAIYELTQHYNAAAVLCTATQPNLDAFFGQLFSQKEYKIPEISRAAQTFVEEFQRVRFQLEGKISDEELEEKLQKEKQVLCIVNKKDHAQKLFESIGNEEGNFHLSAYMYPEHRRKTIEEIKKRLENGKECRVISTSLIEAGVDVDFPAVYRAISGLDSILQAAGRCNRENKRSKENSVVHVFDTEEIVAYQQMNVDVARRVIHAFEENIYQPEAVKMYFDELYYYKDAGNNGKAFDKEDILARCRKYNFKTVAEKFHLIKDNTETVYIPTEENRREIEDLRNGRLYKGLFRRLGRYAVEVYPKMYELLDGPSAIEVTKDGFKILADKNYYDKKRGLILPGKQLGCALFC